MQHDTMQKTWVRHDKPQCQWCTSLTCLSPPSGWSMEIQADKWAVTSEYIKCCFVATSLIKSTVLSFLTDGRYGDERWGGGCPLLVKHDMTTGGRPDGKGSGQHTGVLWVHILHAHDICTYSALIYRVVKSGLFCHVIIWWRGRWHSDRLPLESGQRVEKQRTSCKGSSDFKSVMYEV